MPLLQFLPWCPISSACQAGQVTLLPYAQDDELGGVDNLALQQIRTILACYRGLDGQPVRNLALVRYGEQPILADISEPERAITRECIELVRAAAIDADLDCRAGRPAGGRSDFSRKLRSRL